MAISIISLRAYRPLVETIIVASHPHLVAPRFPNEPNTRLLAHMRKHPEITHEYTCESVRIRLKTNYETSILEVS